MAIVYQSIGLLAIICFTVGLICWIYPIRKIRIPTRKRAVAVILISFVVFISVGSMIDPESESIQRAKSQVADSQEPESGVANQQESEIQSTQQRVQQEQSIEAAWIAHPYEVVEDLDISFSDRLRRRVSIVSPKALTPEDRIATLMEAARQSWQKHHAQFTTVFLLPVESAPAIARIDFAPDKCGITGEDCTDRVWTDVYASDVDFTPEKKQIYTAWMQNSDKFIEVDPTYGFEIVNEERLKAFLATMFDTTPDEISNAVLQINFAYAAQKEMSIPDHLKIVEFDDRDLIQANEKACQAILQCWGDKHSISASVTCSKHIELLAKLDSEWTDGLLQSKFSRFRWDDRQKGSLTYIGDQIKFLNHFGAWIPHIYHCDFDPFAQQVLEVRAFQGKL